MSLNSTPSGERIHIGFFGRRNAGKSSLVNAITGQNLSIVSDKKGTTTDPVYKAMELLPLGPVMLIDTPGFDDEGTLGELRIQKTREILAKTDIAVLVVDVVEGIAQPEKQLLKIFKEKQIPFLVVYNKCDLLGNALEPHLSEKNLLKQNTQKTTQIDFVRKEMSAENIICVSSFDKSNIHELKERLGKLIQEEAKEKYLVADLLKPMSVVVLVIPIDSAAPKGRLILPQQQVIRELLEAGGITVTVKETELKETLKKFGEQVSLVITDSQVFEHVAEIVPKNILLTSFSILMARYKGFLDIAIKGVEAIENLKDGDRILISEGCTHHRQCDDIGTVKIPNWLKKHTGKELYIETTSGREFPEDLSKYALVIHCGGCMLNEREALNRMNNAVEQGIPFTNYGIAIAQMKGILERSIEILK